MNDKKRSRIKKYNPNLIINIRLQEIKLDLKRLNPSIHKYLRLDQKFTNY